jgi:hypothetical protein
MPGVWYTPYVCPCSSVFGPYFELPTNIHHAQQTDPLCPRTRVRFTAQVVATQFIQTMGGAGRALGCRSSAERNACGGNVHTTTRSHALALALRDRQRRFLLRTPTAHR